MSTNLITSIPNGFIYINNKIYIPAQIINDNIPSNSIIYKNKIYQELMPNSNYENNNKINDNQIKIEEKNEREIVDSSKKEENKKVKIDRKGKNKSTKISDKKKDITNTIEEEIFITLKELYSRYKLTGKFFKENSYLDKYGTTGSGANLAKYVLKRIIEEKRFGLLFRFPFDMGARFIGMKVGKR